jgi:hypothetical protein
MTAGRSATGIIFVGCNGEGMSMGIIATAGLWRALTILSFIHCLVSTSRRKNSYIDVPYAWVQ